MASAPYRRFKSDVRARAFVHDGVKTLTADTTASRASNAGKTTVLSAVAGFTVTLPTSTGSGDRYRFLVGTALTSATYVIKVNNVTDVMNGGILINDIGDTSAATADFFPTASTSDTITMTQSIGGGKIGDWVEIEDATSGHWMVRGMFQGYTDPATPFSATV